MECAVGSKEEVIALNTLLVSQQAEIFELKSNTGLEDWFIELTKKTKPMKKTVDYNTSRMAKTKGLGLVYLAIAIGAIIPLIGFVAGFI